MDRIRSEMLLILKSMQFSYAGELRTALRLTNGDMGRPPGIFGGRLLSLVRTRMKLQTLAISLALGSFAAGKSFAASMSTPPEAKVAAIVDGHDIPMDEIVAKSLLLAR